MEACGNSITGKSCLPTLRDVLDSEEDKGAKLFRKDDVGPPLTVECPKYKLIAGTLGGLMNFASPLVSSSSEEAPSWDGIETPIPESEM